MRPSRVHLSSLHALTVFCANCPVTSLISLRRSVCLPQAPLSIHSYMPCLPSLVTRHTWTSWSASPPPNGADLGDNTRGEMSRGMLLMLELELLRWRNRQQKGRKPWFRFCSVLLKNRGFGTDFDNRNNAINDPHYPSDYQTFG